MALPPGDPGHSFRGTHEGHIYSNSNKIKHKLEKMT